MRTRAGRAWWASWRCRRGDNSWRCRGTFFSLPGRTLAFLPGRNARVRPGRRKNVSLFKIAISKEWTCPRSRDDECCCRTQLFGKHLCKKNSCVHIVSVAEDQTHVHFVKWSVFFECAHSSFVLVNRLAARLRLQHVFVPSPHAPRTIGLRCPNFSWRSFRRRQCSLCIVQENVRKRDAESTQNNSVSRGVRIYYSTGSTPENVSCGVRIYSRVGQGRAQLCSSWPHKSSGVVCLGPKSSLGVSSRLWTGWPHQVFQLPFVMWHVGHTLCSVRRVYDGGAIRGCFLRRGRK